MIPASFWKELAVAEIEPAQQERYISCAKFAEQEEVRQAQAKEDDAGLRNAALHYAITAFPGQTDLVHVAAAGTYLQFLKGNDKDFQERMQAMVKTAESSTVSHNPV